MHATIYIKKMRHHGIQNEQNTRYARQSNINARARKIRKTKRHKCKSTCKPGKPGNAEPPTRGWIEPQQRTHAPQSQNRAQRHREHNQWCTKREQRTGERRSARGGGTPHRGAPRPASGSVRHHSAKATHEWHGNAKQRQRREMRDDRVHDARR